MWLSGTPEPWGRAKGSGMLDAQATWERASLPPGGILDKRDGWAQILSWQCLIQLVCSMRAFDTLRFHPLSGSGKEVGQPANNWVLSLKSWDQTGLGKGWQGTAESRVQALWTGNSVKSELPWSNKCDQINLPQILKSAWLLLRYVSVRHKSKQPESVFFLSNQTKYLGFFPLTLLLFWYL